MQPEDGTAQSRPERLSKDAILDIAEGIASTEGTQKLTLRRLGDQLGVNHTAMYRYFPNKQELLNAVADRLLEKGATPQPDLDYRETIRGHLVFGVSRYHVHPDLAQLIAMRPATADAVAGITERSLAVLRSLGLSPRDAGRVFDLMEALVVGFGLFTSMQRLAIEAGELPDSETERRLAAALPPDRFPEFTMCAPYMFSEPEMVFEHAIEQLLNEVDRLAEANRGAMTDEASRQGSGAG